MKYKTLFILNFVLETVARTYELRRAKGRKGRRKNKKSWKEGRKFKILK